MHTTVPKTVLRHKSKDATVSGRTVTSYDAAFLEAILESAVEQNQPSILKRNSMPVDAGHDTFVAHKWVRIDKVTQISVLKPRVT